MGGSESLRWSVGGVSDSGDGFSKEEMKDMVDYYRMALSVMKIHLLKMDREGETEKWAVGR